ncbi:MAG: hypothetical protein ACLP1X_02580 [Polyangiaceae bacterium]
MLDVHVFPPERVQAALPLAGERGQGVQDAPAEGHDHLAVRVGALEQGEHLAGVQEAKELVWVALGAQVARNGVAPVLADAQREDREVEQPPEALVGVAASLRPELARVRRHDG